MLEPVTLPDLFNAISLPVLVVGATPCALPDGPTTDLFGRAVAPANPSAQPVQGGGVTDERHLWPVWFNLIRECRPGVVFGEQVEAAVKHGWLDLVQSDLESEGYACGAAGIPAAGVGAPHIRQRLWFVADANSGRHDGWATATGRQAGASARVASSSASDQLADSQREGLEGYVRDERNRDEPRRLNAQQAGSVAPSSGVGSLGNTTSIGRKMAVFDGSSSNASAGVGQTDVRGGRGASSPSNGFWSDCDWLPCRDGKARPVEPGTFPLAHGVSARVGRLRAYGNAIVPQVAQAFIEAYLET